MDSALCLQYINLDLEYYNIKIEICQVLVIDSLLRMKNFKVLTM
jgi:hypothetical protein